MKKPAEINPKVYPKGFDMVRDQDRYLPIANVARIMKRCLPRNAKIAKEGKEAVKECVSEFISFVTSEASEKCMAHKRKTVSGEDIIGALSALGFRHYVEPLTSYLQVYKECARVDSEAAKVAAKQAKTKRLAAEKAALPPLTAAETAAAIEAAIASVAAAIDPESTADLHSDKRAKELALGRQR
jgi:nuclear transcription Y subunit beta